MDELKKKPDGFAVLGMFATVALTAIVDGFVISLLWKWSISIGHACGLDAFCRILVPHAATSDISLAGMVARTLWRAAAVAGIGYVAHLVAG